jgi:hypothetical protein
METMFGKKIFIDYYKPKEFKNKEKVEEVGVTMKQMIHNFMMTVVSQARGRPTRGRRGGGRGAGGFSGYPGASMQHSSYTQAVSSNSNASAGANYGRPPPPLAKNTPGQHIDYSGHQFGPPPMPAGMISGHPFAGGMGVGSSGAPVQSNPPIASKPGMFYCFTV